MNTQDLLLKGLTAQAQNLLDGVIYHCLELLEELLSHTNTGVAMLI
jgi:hypothetical protein